MAIDTANERGSILEVLPIPDGSISAGDRAELLELFVGFYTAGVGPEPEPESTEAEEEDLCGKLRLLDIIQIAAAELKQPVPGAVIGSNDTTAKLLLALAKREIKEERSLYAWPQLQKELIITLISGQASYAFDCTHDRQIFDTHWDRTNHWPLVGPVTPQVWQQLKSGSVTSTIGRRFRIKSFIDNQIFIDPTPAGGDAGQSLVFEYQTKTCIRPKSWLANTAYSAGGYSFYNGNIYQTTSGGTSGSTAPTHTTGGASDGGISWSYYADPYDVFLNDTDISLLDDDVLILGIKWRWRQTNGFDYGAERQEWNELLKRRYTASKGSRVLSLAPRRSSRFVSSMNVPDSNYGA